MRWLLLLLGCFLAAYLIQSVLSPLAGFPLMLARILVWGSFGGILSFVGLVIRRRRGKSSAWDAYLLRVSHFGMAFLSFLLMLTFFRDVLSWSGLQSLQSVEASLSLLTGSLLLMSVGFWKARSMLKVQEVWVPVPHLPPALEGLRIVQLSDLHISEGVRKDYVEKVARLANECRADVVVMTGDIGDAPAEELAQDAEPLASIQARYGRYFVSGNHEYYWDAAAWNRVFEKLGYRVLHNQTELLNVGGAQLLIAGVPDPAALYFGGEGPRLKEALSSTEREKADFTLLLAHQSKVAREAEQSGVNLLISGHTHGGQFYPWTWIVKWIDPFPHGLRRLGKMWIYVSRGTGYWGPPIRLGAPSEVTLLILKNDSNSLTS